MSWAPDGGGGTMESWKPTRTNREAGPSKDTGTKGNAIYAGASTEGDSW